MISNTYNLRVRSGPEVALDFSQFISSHENRKFVRSLSSFAKREVACKIYSCKAVEHESGVVRVVLADPSPLDSFVYARSRYSTMNATVHFRAARRDLLDSQRWTHAGGL